MRLVRLARPSTSGGFGGVQRSIRYKRRIEELYRYRDQGVHQEALLFTTGLGMLYAAARICDSALRGSM